MRQSVKTFCSYALPLFINRPSIAIKPIKIIPIPRNTFHSSRSFNAIVPSNIALIGIKNVTNRMLVAPEVANTRNDPSQKSGSLVKPFSSD